MSESIMAEICRQYCATQDDMLDLVAGLTDEQIVWTPNETTPSIGFHIWHLARWADYLQEIINGLGSQLWEKEGLAARWDMETESLGYAQTGMSMDDKTAMTLRIPTKDLLLDYARRAFASAQQAVERISDAEFYKIYEGLHGENWHDGHIGPIISTWMTHDNRHLGMIECLIGIQGMHGTADS
jgi:DinB superfamily